MSVVQKRKRVARSAEYFMRRIVPVAAARFSPTRVCNPLLLFCWEPSRLVGGLPVFWLRPARYGLDKNIRITFQSDPVGEIMKNKAILAVLLAITALSAGCNTVSGAGKDIERGGEKIQGAAK